MCATRDPGYRGDSGLEPLPVDELDEQERPLWAILHFWISGRTRSLKPPAGNRLACSLNHPFFWTKAQREMRRQCPSGPSWPESPSPSLVPLSSCPWRPRVVPLGPGRICKRRDQLGESGWEAKASSAELNKKVLSGSACQAAEGGAMRSVVGRQGCRICTFQQPPLSSICHPCRQ